MLGYPNQPTRKAFDGVTVTGSYADNQFVMIADGMSKLTLDIKYAMGATESANTLKFKLEHSPDNGVTWFSLVIDETGATSVLTDRVWDIVGTSNKNVIIDIAYKLLRISLTETGVAANAGTASVDYTLSGI